MSQPYNDDGEFCTMAHVLTAGEIPPAILPSAIIVIPEYVPLRWKEPRLVQRRVSAVGELLENAGGIQQTTTMAGEEQNYYVFRALKGEDLWFRVKQMERNLCIPVTAIPKRFVSFELYCSEYPRISEELHAAEGDLAATPTYQRLLEEAIETIQSARRTTDAVSAWNDLVAYFPVPERTRNSMLRVLAKKKGAETQEFRDLINTIKKH